MIQVPAASARPPGDLNPRTDPPLDFPDRELEEMTPGDYQTLGFMCGLEVHQQLATAGKLFCRCPAGRRVGTYDAEVLRHMRPTLSELGEYDGTALMEFKTKKEIVYLLDRGTVCTYEIDDTPPFEIDREAVRVSIALAELLNLNLVSELHVMRKQYLDGSIPTGFQRTAMIGLGGAIPFREPALGIDRELHIRQLSLEEDSCREVSNLGHRITFRTDRLGTPLTETVTEPELLTPFEVQAGGRLLARVAHATGRVRRGPGAARQDVNVSVAGGRRVEIKGVHHHRGLPRLVHIEAFRQLNLLRIREELLRRGVPAELLELPATGLPWEQSPLAIDAGQSLRQLDFAPIRDALGRGDFIAAVRLPGFGGLLQRRTQPGVTFAREIADRLRVIACLTDRPFLIHSDVPDYGLNPPEWRALKQRLGANKWDAVIVLWGPAEDAATAVREVFLRAKEALRGVPAETRQAYKDGTTGFERILPGPDRMYPDTDTPPLPIPDRWVQELRAGLAERPWEREARYQALGLPPDLARRLGARPWAALFDGLAPPASVARRVAFALDQRLTYHLRRGLLAAPPTPDRLAPWVEALVRGSILPEACSAALDALLCEPHANAADVLRRFAPHPSDGQALTARARELGRECRALRFSSAQALGRWAMGRTMPDLLGRLPAAKVADALHAELALGEER